MTAQEIQEMEDEQVWIEQQRERAAESGSGAGRLTDAAHARDLHEDRRERQLEELEGWAGAQ